VCKKVVAVATSKCRFASCDVSALVELRPYKRLPLLGAPMRVGSFAVCRRFPPGKKLFLLLFLPKKVCPLANANKGTELSRRFSWCRVRHP
jgi:hypothetical protein